ncbi:hypothetical protein AKO1_001139 [Acrasis kona]|uniref:Uncharacterized protein n=1 Tax=Acrasis kona TaxID=1008807 RepID=A0AAW2ZTJ9_9EUKA
MREITFDHFTILPWTFTDKSTASKSSNSQSASTKKNKSKEQKSFKSMDDEILTRIEHIEKSIADFEKRLSAVEESLSVIKTKVSDSNDMMRSLMSSMEVLLARTTPAQDTHFSDEDDDMFYEEPPQPIPSTDPVNSVDFHTYFQPTTTSNTPKNPTRSSDPRKHSIASPTKRSKAKSNAKAKSAKVQQSLTRFAFLPDVNNPPFKPPSIIKPNQPILDDHSTPDDISQPPSPPLEQTH